MHAVLDTDVLVLLLGDPKTKQRTERARARIKQLQEKGFTLWIPPAALAEMVAGGKSLAQIGQRLSGHLAKYRLTPFTPTTAEICGRMVQAALARAEKGGSPYPSTRQAMKFDALIAASAAHVEARYMVTCNPDHFSQHFEAVNAGVIVHQPDVAHPDFPEQFPLKLVPRVEPPAEGELPAPASTSGPK